MSATKTPGLRRMTLIVLAVLSLVSIWQGMHNAALPDRSQDFQWSGAHLFWQHIDPWRDYLSGDPVHGIVKVQIPNYLPLLYVMLAPLGSLPLETASLIWAVCNLVFGIVSAFLCGRFYGLNTPYRLVLTALLLTSTPLRNSIGNGQQGIFVLLLWVLALCCTEKPSNGLVMGVSYFKYSFAPPAFLFLLFRFGFVTALLSLAPALATFLFAFLWLGGSLRNPAAMLSMLTAPMKVAQTGFFGSAGPNLMDILEWGLTHLHVAPGIVKIAVFTLPLIIAAALLFRKTRPTSGLSLEGQISLMAIISIALFKHHSYDTVVLLFPVAYCLRNLHEHTARWALGLLCYLWYGERLLRAAGLQQDWNFLTGFVVLCAVTVLIEQTDRAVQRKLALHESCIPSGTAEAAPSRAI